jgi:hypothetical protein
MCGKGLPFLITAVFVLTACGSDLSPPTDEMPDVTTASETQTRAVTATQPATTEPLSEPTAEPPPSSSVTFMDTPPERSDEDYTNYSGVAYRNNSGNADSNVLISAERDNSVVIVNVRKSFTEADNTPYYVYEDFSFGFGMGHHFHGSKIFYGTFIPHDSPFEAVVIRNFVEGYTKSYVLERDENGDSAVIEAEIHGLPENYMQTYSEYLYERPNTLPIKMYTYADDHSTMYGDEKNFSYTTVYIPEESFLEEAAKFMFLQGGFSVNSIWYEGNRLYADFNLSELQRHGHGSAGSFAMKAMLVRTLSSFPEVKEIAVLFDGYDVFAGHSRFDGIFTVNGDLWEDIGFIPHEEV